MPVENLKECQEPVNNQQSRFILGPNNISSICQLEAMNVRISLEEWVGGRIQPGRVLVVNKPSFTRLQDGLTRTRHGEQPCPFRKSSVLQTALALVVSAICRAQLSILAKMKMAILLPGILDLI